MSLFGSASSFRKLIKPTGRTTYMLRGEKIVDPHLPSAYFLVDRIRFEFTVAGRKHQGSQVLVRNYERDATQVYLRA